MRPPLTLNLIIADSSASLETGLRRLSGLGSTAIGLVISTVLVSVFALAYSINPLDLFHTIYRAAFGSTFALENTLSRAGPLMLTGLAVAIPARAGLVVVGGEGSIVLAGLATAVVSRMIVPLPPGLGILLLGAVGMLVGGAWMGLAGYLKVARGVSEVLSTLLLVWIAQAVFDFLVEGELRDPKSLNFPATLPVPEAYRVGLIPGMDNHWGLPVGVLACLLGFVLMNRTIHGFAARIVGGNARAAQALGISVGFHTIVACLISGALAGLTGSIEILAVHGQASGALTHAGYGFTGILVAFLARHHPLAILPAAILVGGLSASSGLIQRNFEVPGSFMQVVEGLVFISILASETLRAPIRAYFWKAQN